MNINIKSIRIVEMNCTKDSVAVLIFYALYSTFAAVEIQEDNTHNASAKITHGGKRETEGTATCHTESFVSRSYIVCLTRALTVSHGKQYAACREQVGHKC